MDTLTHALAGALLARATAPSEARPGDVSTRARVVAGAFAAAFPDIDFVAGYLSPVAYLENHRGITHSILLLPAWALVAAWLCALAARDPRRIGRWYPVCVLGIASHIALDLITSFGTMILAPVSKERFALGTTFIIDLWFSGIILAGLAASWYWRRTRMPAVLASFALAGYVGLQASAKAEAERFGVRHAEALGLAGAQVQAHPRPVSPFNWTVFVIAGERIAYAHVNLVRRKPRPAPDRDAGFIARLDAAYRPLTDARWETRMRYGGDDSVWALSRSAWNSKALASFRWFARIPAFDGVTDGGSCVWFRDLRFDTPGRDGAVPFRYGACRNGPDERWQLRTATGT